MEDSLGRVTVPTPGTLVRATINLPDPAARAAYHGVLFQAWYLNSGKVFIGKSNMNKVTGVGVLGTLAVPTVNTLPTFSMAITLAPAGVRLDDVWIDADVSGDGCTVAVMIA